MSMWTLHYLNLQPIEWAFGPTPASLALFTSAYEIYNHYADLQSENWRQRVVETPDLFLTELWFRDQHNRACRNREEKESYVLQSRSEQASFSCEKGMPCSGGLALFRFVKPITDKY